MPDSRICSGTAPLFFLADLAELSFSPAAEASQEAAKSSCQYELMAEWIGKANKKKNGFKMWSEEVQLLECSSCLICFLCLVRCMRGVAAGCCSSSVWVPGKRVGG